jgi:hypothetical protein
VTRRRPGSDPSTEPGPLPPPEPALPYEFVPVPDRWRLVESIGVNQRWWDPYHQNTLKADRPIFGSQDWFVNFALISDSVYEPRRIPTPIGVGTERGSGSLDVFGDGDQYVLNENLIASVSLIQGNQVFRPPDWEFRATAVFNWNYISTEVTKFVNAREEEGIRRYDNDIAIQELFIDRHVTNLSDRYDFFSIRAGIQGFTSDFRGFLYQDNRPGVRIFGNYFNNRLQWNLAWFNMLEKDINSGLNSIFERRNDHLYIANVYLQDFPVLGFTVQGTVLYNDNQDGDRPRKFDKNGFQQRPYPLGDQKPKNYDVTYLGLNGDGHFGRLNLTFSGYYAFGDEDHNQIAQQRTDIDAWFLAGEASVDFDWYRLKAFALHQSGDNDPDDGEAEGFDTIFDNPQFAGADTSFWHRQVIPFIGASNATLTTRNSLVSNLRTSKEQGQANFVNPGLGLVGVGADFDLLPELRLLLNTSALWWENTSSLRRLRQQEEIDNQIGYDVSAGIVYRPWFTQNVVLRLSGAVLFPEDGFERLFSDRGQDPPYYSVLANLILTY